MAATPHKPSAADRETAERLRDLLTLYLSERPLSAQLNALVRAVLRSYRGIGEPLKERKDFDEWSLRFLIAQCAWLAVQYRNDEAVRSAVGIAAYHWRSYYPNDEPPTDKELAARNFEVKEKLNELDNRLPPTKMTVAGRIMTVLCPQEFPSDSRPGVRNPRRAFLELTKPEGIDP